jgi:hypothetical protein
VVDELPYLFEEMVAFNYKLSEGKAEDMLEIPLRLILELMIEVNGRLVKLGIR